jgi:hypothetical protein
MKKQVYSFLVIAALLVIASGAPANAQSGRLVRASVPFDFVIKEKALPAGNYTFEALPVGGSEALRVQSSDGHISVIVLTEPVRREGDEAQAKIVFNRFGDQYFLSQVWGLAGARLTLHQSHREYELAKSGNAPKPVTVPVSGRR